MLDWVHFESIDIDFVKINPLLPNILINAFPKLIYSYAAASPQLNFYFFFNF